MLSASDNGLAEIQFFQNNEKNKTPSKTNNKTLLTAGRQLMEYFKGERSDFDIPLDIQGSDFQKKVWKNGWMKILKEVAKHFAILNTASIPCVKSIKIRTVC